MGTNFYHIYNSCDHCGRSDKRHIGKSSAGWEFHFHGYQPNPRDSDPTRIESYQDWLRVVETDGKIIDEYGRTIPLEEFKRWVEARKEGRATLPELVHWRDAEGHSFSTLDFS